MTARRGHLGIDLGTSAVKVLVHDAAGAVLAKTQRGYPTRAVRPGWAEQAPSDWWRETAAAVAEAVRAAGAEIVSVGLSGQLNGFVLLDGAGAPLGDAIIWLDLRAADEAGRLAAGAQPPFEAATGNELSAIAVLPKLAWLQARDPALLARAHRIALAKDYILLRLTGVLATDPSDAASTAMTPRGGRAWAPELCALAPVEPALLPPILPSAAVAGQVSPAAAAETGLAAGTPVATGAGDVAALAVGCGIVRPGRTAITLGTAGHVVAEVAGEPARRRGLWRIPHAVPGRELWLGLIMSGGLSLRWLRDVLGAGAPPPDYAVLDRLAGATPAGSEGVTFLPFLEGAATPHNWPDAHGMLFGLASSHGSGHVVRAVLEGVAFNARECIEALAEAGVESGEIRLAEGGARSPVWCQVLADALDRPVRLIGDGDTSAAGAAILGRAALAGGDVAAIAEQVVQVDRVFEPQAAAVAALDEAYARYRAMCALLASRRTG
ncbi:FGGY family carbohydrate kinase [Aquibium sp. A9E412]|uniref:xylulokinase n=1 Tax=Aquibium sp. A9E412 TaxID=2976767 RepID=UPI0025AF025F|nr:FGGY family carbohydrate kinase [Aquibium sp. A9E412]MDN2566960.1 FGGY family carbohydrate kinase [Aquibium sp. A9E412]